MVQLIVNEKVLDTTKIMLFFANLEKKSNLFRKLRDNKSA